MRILEKRQADSRALLTQCRVIDFMHDLANEAPVQVQALLEQAVLLEAKPGDVVVRKGDLDSRVYFLLEGELIVYLDHQDGKQRVINYIGPGEEFGSVAVMRQIPRTATVVASPLSPVTQVLGLDFSVLADFNDMSQLQLKTKLLFFRHLVKINQQRLSRYCATYPYGPLVRLFEQLPAFTRHEGSLDELRYLHGKMMALSVLLCNWNQALEPLADIKPLLH